MSGFAKFCMVARFIALGFAILFLGCWALFKYGPAEYVESYFEQNNLDPNDTPLYYLVYAVVCFVLSFIAFLIHGVSKARYKKVLRIKSEIGYCFDDMVRRMENGYDEQADTTFKVVWKNPKRKGSSFKVIFYCYVPRSYVHGGTTDLFTNNFKQMIDGDYAYELDNYSFDWRVQIKSN